jgi:hypothetical protein
MKKIIKDEMKAEYDFRGKKGVRGKYHEAMKNGYTTIIHKSDGTTETIETRPIFLEQDLKAHFPTSESVNPELRSDISVEKIKS